LFSISIFTNEKEQNIHTHIQTSKILADLGIILWIKVGIFNSRFGFTVHRSGFKTCEPLNAEPHNPDQVDVRSLSKGLKIEGIAVAK
jgi:hypothetical protein